MKIVHLITDVGVGGAQSMLLKLLGGMDRRRFENVVVSMTGPGTIGSQMEAAGIRVLDLGMTRRRVDLAALFRLRRLLLDEQPDILQTWLYHADLLGTLANLAGPRIATPAGRLLEAIRDQGFPWHPIVVHRATNMLRELRSIPNLVALYRRLHPDIVHHVAVKAVLYGTMAARISGVPAVVDGETGLLVPPRDAVALSEAIASLLDDEPKRRAMGRRARERVLERFTVERINQTTLSTYDHLLRKTTASTIMR